MHKLSATKNATGGGSRLNRFNLHRSGSLILGGRGLVVSKIFERIAKRPRVEGGKRHFLALVTVSACAASDALRGDSSLRKAQIVWGGICSRCFERFRNIPVGLPRHPCMYMAVPLHSTPRLHAAITRNIPSRRTRAAL